MFGRLQNRLSKTGTTKRSPELMGSTGSTRSMHEYTTQTVTPSIHVETENCLHESSGIIPQMKLRDLAAKSSDNLSHTTYDGQSRSAATFYPKLQASKSNISQSPYSSKTNSEMSKQHQKDGGHRAKTPISSFYNVSSDEEEDFADGSDDEDGQMLDHNEERGLRRSQRFRRSVDKAKAALPLDFADRIGMTTDQTKISNVRLPESDNEETLAQGSDEGDGNASELDGRQGVEENRNSDNLDEIGYQNLHSISSQKIGIQWSSEAPKSLEALMCDIRNAVPGSSYLLRSICQRSGCRCAFRDHDCLMAFVVLDATVALANWCIWAPVTKTQSRFNPFESSANSAFPVTKSELELQLIVFRQCRGWFEVLNENFQAVPHLTTVEQLRQAKPSMFVTRRDLKCLLAPPYLEVPIIKPAPRANGDGPPPPPYPSSVISMATSTETLMAATAESIPTGTLLHYITYLPHCQVRRGKKLKELGLSLAVQRASIMQSNNLDNISDRVLYIGLEDGTPAVFPNTFALSPVAGPENISGVHSLASILRKFRLPLSIRPVGMPENVSSQQRPDSINSGLLTIPELSFREKSYLRLQSIYRSDLLIISPVNNPERLFLITPAMLRDHLFTTGSSEDPLYIRLLNDHRAHANGFLASAHKKDTLNYLIRHMNDITREPRESYSSHVSTKGKNADPWSNTDLPEEDFYHVCEEIDDIYFYIRHGYYPSSVRRSEPSVKTENSRHSRVPANNYGHIPATESRNTTQAHSATKTMNMTTAEELLAASLNSPARTSNNHVNRHATFHGRGLTKEHGI